MLCEKIATKPPDGSTKLQKAGRVSKAAEGVENTRPYGRSCGTAFGNTAEYIGYAAIREANDLIQCFGRSGLGIGKKWCREFTAIKLL